MGRDYFNFKQFSIQQKKSAMRVGTDGVLLGAWVSVSAETNYILDVGTGTGLLALMLAQRCSRAHIHGVECDADAYGEACYNFASSKWDQRLSAFHSTFQQYAGLASIKYELIVCNPPFFSGGIKNACSKKAIARHNDVLGHDAILKGSESLLEQGGCLGVILPFSEYGAFQETAVREGWFELERTHVRPTPGKLVKRVLSRWGRQQNFKTRINELVVEQEFHVYSPEYKALTNAFYLGTEE